MISGREIRHRPKRTKAYHATSLRLTKNATASIVVVDRQMAAKKYLTDDCPRPLYQRGVPAKLLQLSQKRLQRHGVGTNNQPELQPPAVMEHSKSALSRNSPAINCYPADAILATLTSPSRSPHPHEPAFTARPGMDDPAEQP